MDYITNIKKSKLTIYDKINTSDDQLYIPIYDLQNILNDNLKGISLSGLALRTRSKVVKTKICEALGYPVPKSFIKTQPRFVGQNFDVYTQKSSNVQIWNEEIEAIRRYVFIQVSENDEICCVKVISGDVLATFDNTGTLTHKYQATMTSRQTSVLFTNNDTDKMNSWIKNSCVSLENINPNQNPDRSQLLPISTVYSKLLPMVGKTIDYLDAVQERNRGAELHKMVCRHLGYNLYNDNGSYPDLVNQLIEIKLQTSPTIDLGLHSPENEDEIVKTPEITFNSKDIRYVIFDSTVQDDRILLKYIYVVNGNDFTKYFPLFKGLVKNAKLQFSLPKDFFD